jgi:DNA repair and recombination protein RAD52
MTLSTEQHALLDRPLAQDQIATRTVGKGRQAAYLEGFEAIRQANRVFGHGGWGMTVDDLQFHAMSSGGFYRATVTVTVAGCEPQQDVGGCVAQNDTAEQHDMAFKGAVTDAMKRALRHYGAAFGNDLYSDDAPVAAATAQQQPARAQTQPARWPAPLEHEPTGQQQEADQANFKADQERLIALMKADAEGTDFFRARKLRVSQLTERELADWLVWFRDRAVTPDAQAATV